MKATAETFHKAIEFATKAHKGVYRKGNGEPYIMHPISVAARIRSVKGDSTNLFHLMTAAVLHDTDEDCEWVDLEMIGREFGFDVAGLVEELTLDKSKYNTIGKKEYLAQEVVTMSSYALAIKLCDRLENLIDMKKMGKKFQTNYTAETNYVLANLEAKRAKITNTHKKLIDLIKTELEPYQILLQEN